MTSAPRTATRPLSVTALVVAAASLAACTAEPDASPAPSASTSAASAPPASVLDVATGLDAPWSMVVVGDSVLVSERNSGEITEITAESEVRTVTTVPDVRFGGEGGLLGLAVAPEGDRLFAFSTTDRGSRVDRYELSGEPGALTLGAPTEILSGLPSSTYHNGGRIEVGPDGMLYVTTGDAGDRPAAQDLDSLAGKILRVDADGDAPDDNPFPGSPVYSYGHRNPQGIAWTSDGRMFSSEFGQDTWDELNEIQPGGNYGWPVVEGIGEDEDFIDPVQTWAPQDASPSGLTAVDDVLYLSNLRGERLRAIPASDPTRATEYFAGEYGRLRASVLGPDGRLWIATSNLTGRGVPRDGDDRIVSVDLSTIPAQ